MELSIKDFDFLNSVEHLGGDVLDINSKKKLNFFVLRINANEFDYTSLKNNLIDPMIDFSLSRKVREKYSGKPGTLSSKAREKFVNYLNNKGELGELLLYCFLETHLKAPKLLSKLELKTSTSQYVNGSDGVHFLKLDDGNYQLIFGESKTIAGLTAAISDAFNSIYEFKNCINSKDNKKSGLPYEKALLSDHLEKETFSDEQRIFIEKIIYPTRQNDFYVDDAFGVFVGYETKVSKEDKALTNADFREKIKEQIRSEITSSYEHIRKKIKDFDLDGHDFYIYILPFTNLDENRAELQKGIST